MDLQERVMEIRPGLKNQDGEGVGTDVLEAGGPCGEGRSPGWEAWGKWGGVDAWGGWMHFTEWYRGRSAQPCGQLHRRCGLGWASLEW